MKFLSTTKEEKITKSIFDAMSIFLFCVQLSSPFPFRYNLITLAVSNKVFVFVSFEGMFHARTERSYCSCTGRLSQ